MQNTIKIYDHSQMPNLIDIEESYPSQQIEVLLVSENFTKLLEDKLLKHAPNFEYS